MWRVTQFNPWDSQHNWIHGTHSYNKAQSRVCWKSRAQRFHNWVKDISARTYLSNPAACFLLSGKVAGRGVTLFSIALGTLMTIALVYVKRSYRKANKVSHRTPQREKTGRHRKKCCELKFKNGKKSTGEVFFHIISSMILLLHLFCLWRLRLAIHIPSLCLEIAVHEVKGEGKEKKKSRTEWGRHEGVQGRRDLLSIKVSKGGMETCSPRSWSSMVQLVFSGC